MAGLNLSHILEIAKRGLQTQRLGIDVTGHNLANATKEGYSRQRINLKPGEVLQSNQGNLGTGVIGTHGGRVRNMFIDDQVRSSQSSLSQSSAQRQSLTRIESKVNELTRNGLGTQITKFFNSFQSLAQQPEDSVQRTNVVNQAKRMIDSFRSTYNAYQQLQKEVNDNMLSTLRNINEISSKIADIDSEITRLQSGGANASDLKDERDILIDELSKYANVKVSEDSRGSVIVSIGGIAVASRGGSTELSSSFIDEVGQTALVLNGVTYDTDTKKYDLTDFSEVTLDAIPKLSITIPAYNDDSTTDPSLRKINITSGELKGLMDVYNDVLFPAKTRLNTMAISLANAVNSLHQTGKGRMNADGENIEGINFFVSPTDVQNAFTGDDIVNGEFAKYISISNEILQDANNIATASVDLDEFDGGNSVALQISNLMNQKFMTGKLFYNENETLPTSLSQTLEEYNRQTTNQLSSAIFDAEIREESSELILNQMQQQQQSISGVSTDEEMTNLINFQRAYDAAAKVTATVNDMYLTILNMV